MIKIKRINILILLISLAGFLASWAITKRFFISTGFFAGGIVFLFLFLHLQIIIKDLFKKRRRYFIFTYFLRLFLISLFFYGSIIISKDFFLLTMLGFIISSLSLIGEGIINIFTKGESDG